MMRISQTLPGGNGEAAKLGGPINSHAMHRFLEQSEADVHSQPSPIKFEMACQTQVIIDRLKFAIKYTETIRAEHGTRNRVLRQPERRLLLSQRTALETTAATSSTPC
jgi:hypothetical protein